MESAGSSFLLPILSYLHQGSFDSDDFYPRNICHAQLGNNLDPNSMLMYNLGGKSL